MIDNLRQGFFGIEIQSGKTPENLGVLWRSAQNMGANFFHNRDRCVKQACDTHEAVGAMSYFHYDTFEDFYMHLPKGAMLVESELTEEAVPLETFHHPWRCAYLLGAEDQGLSKQAIEKVYHLVKINSQLSLNVSVAGSIVMYDRNLNKSRS